MHSEDGNGGLQGGFLKAPQLYPLLPAGILLACLASYGCCAHVIRCPTSRASSWVAIPQ